LRSVHKALANKGVFADATTAGERFLQRVLPARYGKIAPNVNELSEWLCQQLGNRPGCWLTHDGLQKAIEGFVKQKYGADAREKALEKVKSLSDAEAKELFLELIDQLPDVGLFVLE
jgi:hypothetical protein